MSLDNTITSEDKQLFLKILKIRKELTNFINIEDFINEMKININKSESFRFRSKQAEEFIDKKVPIFKLKVIENSKLYEDLNFPKMKLEVNNKNHQPTINVATGKVTEKIYQEIIYNMIYYFKNFIDSNKDIRDRMDEISKENNNLNTNFFLSNMYSIKISPVDNIIFLQYII